MSKISLIIDRLSTQWAMLSWITSHSGASHLRPLSAQGHLGSSVTEPPCATAHKPMISLNVRLIFGLYGTTNDGSAPMARAIRLSSFFLGDTIYACGKTSNSYSSVCLTLPGPFFPHNILPTFYGVADVAWLAGC